MNNIKIKSCGVYFANIPLTKTTNKTICENLNCRNQSCVGCKLESVIIWTQTPDGKCLVIPIIRASIEQHEQNLGSIGDNLALIKIEKSSNNSLLSFHEEDVSYADLNRVIWIKDSLISDEYLVNGELRVLNGTEIYDLSLRVKTLPVSSIAMIKNVGINLNTASVSYKGDSNMKD